MANINPLYLLIALIFAAVALGSFPITTYFLARARVRHRFATASAGAPGLSPRRRTTVESAGPFNLDAQKLGLDASAQRKLRDQLWKAGFFGPQAVVTFTIIRALFVVFVPLATYLLVRNYLGHWETMSKFAVVGVSFLLSYYLPQGYVDRRIRLLQGKVLLSFPDFLDMMVVCVTAGLSLEAAFERVSREIGKERALQHNLGLMLSEMRAGKNTITALKDFAERLGLAEARSLATLLQQSLELGTDVSAALSTYSDEMREKRMSRAEQKAYALPVKLTIPLGLFIFPVLFLAVMTPAVLKVLAMLAQYI